MSKNFKIYSVSIIIALAVGGLSAFLTRNNMNVYSTINTPPLTPPAFLFPIVWTILFVLMGISAAIIYKSHRQNFSALLVYALQLIVNFSWSIIFFNKQAYLFAFLWILLLIYLVGLMIYKFHKISPTAAYLQIPYFLWLIFAAYLNLMIYILNK